MVVSLHTEIRKPDLRFCHTRHIDVFAGESREDNWLLTYFEYESPKDHLIIVQHEAPVDDFLNLYNKFSEGTSKEGAFVLHASGENRFIEKPLKEIVSPLTTQSLKDTFKLAGNETITFIRIDTDRFSISYEGKASCFSSKEPAIDKMSLFAQTLSDVPYREADFQGTFSNIFVSQPS